MQKGSTMQRLRLWFTPERRQAVYLATAALATLLTSTGVITDTDASQYLILASLAIQALAAILQLSNLSGPQVAGWFTRAGRATIYAGAVAVAGAGVALGWFTDAAAADALSILSASLTAFSSVLAVLTLGKEQALEAGINAATDTMNLLEGNPPGDDTFGPCEPNCTADCAKSCPDADPPSSSAPKSAWVDYATALGADVTGLTKQQIIDALTR